MDPIHHNPIPEEIMFVILTMLPVKSLRRFMCVSKLWFSIISDPYFKSAHFARSKSRPKLLISISRLRMSGGIGTGDDVVFYSIDYPEEHHVSPILHVSTHDGSIVNQLRGVISDSVSGLICCHCKRGITVGNPITGEFNLIQYPAAGYKITVARSYLGIDPINQTPVILLLQYYTHGKSSVFSLHFLESQWHNKPNSPQPLITRIPLFYGSSVASINGLIYFTAEKIFIGNIKTGERLYAFDVRSKCFELIQHPPDPKFMVQILIEYKGCIALVGSEDYIGFDHPHMNVIKLWILEDSKKQSWRFESFVVPWRQNELGFRVKLLGATHRGELIFANDQVSEEGSLDLFLYKIDTNTLRRFKVDGFGPTCPNLLVRKVRIGTLMESLYSPK